jgi:hypothetical protein
MARNISSCATYADHPPSTNTISNGTQKLLYQPGKSFGDLEALSVCESFQLQLREDGQMKEEQHILRLCPLE